MNLFQQFDQVVKIVREYRRFLKVAYIRLLTPRRYMNAFSGIARARRDTRNAVVAAALYKEEEKKNPFFAIVLSEHPIHDLSELVEARFPHYDFGRLDKLADLEESWTLRRFKPTKLVAPLIAAATALLKTIPQSWVEHFGLDYALYQRWTLNLLFIALAFILYLVVLDVLAVRSNNEAAQEPLTSLGTSPCALTQRCLRTLHKSSRSSSSGSMTTRPQ